GGDGARPRERPSRGVGRSPTLVRYVRDKRDLARTLDRGLKLPLMHRAGAGDPPRQNLAALRHERADQLHVLVIDIVDLVRAELADLPPAEERPSLSLRFVAGFLVAAAAATAAATTRASLSEWHRLHSLLGPEIEPGICVLVLGLARPAFARLPLRRQPALDAPPLGVG